MWASRELPTPSDRAIRSADHATSRLPDRQLGFGGAGLGSDPVRGVVERARRPFETELVVSARPCSSAPDAPRVVREALRMVWDGTDLNGKSRVFTVLLTQILLTQWGSG